MVERNEGSIPYRAEFTWIHPQNNCPALWNKAIIKEEITAVGPTLEDARRYALILAENTPKICDICQFDYKLQP